MSKKIERDLAILSAMASEMEDYLKSDVLFWPMSQAGFPRLTLGGYLMRQHRLLALRSTLELAQQDQLDAAVTQFNKALVERIVRFEQRAHEELGTRWRQWEQKLKEGFGSKALYASGIETRVIIEALITQLQIPPYQLAPPVLPRIRALDVNLQKRLHGDAFVWDDVWQGAYPAGTYWYLYGTVK